jgi:hypothetical protein
VKLIPRETTSLEDRATFLLIQRPPICNLPCVDNIFEHSWLFDERYKDKLFYGVICKGVSISPRATRSPMFLFTYSHPPWSGPEVALPLFLGCPG